MSEYIVDIFSLDDKDEDIIRLIEMISGVDSIFPYTPPDEVLTERALAEDREKHLKGQIKDYRIDNDQLRKELHQCREAPKVVNASPDYVELIKLRNERETYIFYQKLLEAVGKDVDLGPYMEKVNKRKSP